VLQSGRLLMALWVQPARPGPSGQDALKTAAVSNPTPSPVTRGMAAAPARLASGASGARQVSQVWGGGFQGQQCWAGETGVREGEIPGLLTPLSLSHPAECEPGFFGPGCRHKCTCPTGVACDPVSGECWKQCPAGYQGEDCGQGEVQGPGPWVSQWLWLFVTQKAA
jgi:hypothetical protein